MWRDWRKPRVTQDSLCLCRYSNPVRRCRIGWWFGNYTQVWCNWDWAVLWCSLSQTGWWCRKVFRPLAGVELPGDAVRLPPTSPNRLQIYQRISPSALKIQAGMSAARTTAYDLQHENVVWIRQAGVFRDFVRKTSSRDGVAGLCQKSHQG
jgi:hypothetical protein